jgi:hypothetical protein
MLHAPHAEATEDANDDHTPLEIPLLQDAKINGPLPSSMERQAVRYTRARHGAGSLAVRNEMGLEGIGAWLGSTRIPGAIDRQDREDNDNVPPSIRRKRPNAGNQGIVAGSRTSVEHMGEAAQPLRLLPLRRAHNVKDGGRYEHSHEWAAP